MIKPSKSVHSAYSMSSEIWPERAGIILLIKRIKYQINSILAKMKKLGLFKTNYFKISFKQKEIFQYSFTTDPEINHDSRHKLQNLIYENRTQLEKKIGFLYVRGNSVYGSKFHKHYFELYGEQKIYKIVFRLTREFDNLELMLKSEKTHEKNTALQLINTSLKERLKKLNLFELSPGNFFKKRQKVESEKDAFYVFNGYRFTVSPLNSGIHLQIDYLSKVYNAENFLQTLNRFQLNANEIKQIFVGKVIFTRYGTLRNYIIQDIDFQLNPSSKFRPHNSDQITSYQEFYYSQYELRTKMKKQPLIKAIKMIQKKKKKGGKNEKKITQIYLIPEHVGLTGMMEEQRKNNRLMKEIRNKIQLTPQNRVKKMEEGAQLFKENQLIKIEKQLQIKRCELNPPEIKGNGLIKVKDGTFQNMSIQKPMSLKNWMLIYETRYQDCVQTFLDIIKEAKDLFNIRLSEPCEVQVNGKQLKNLENIGKMIENQFEQLQELPTFVVLILDNKQKLYSKLKQFFHFNLQKKGIFIPTQYIYGENFIRSSKKKGRFTFVNNVLFQMNAKMKGCTLWSINNSNQKKKRVACVSIATSKVGQEYYLGFVGTMNNELTEIYNQTRKIERKEQRLEYFYQILTAWFKEYFQKSRNQQKKEKLPQVIIFYQEGLTKTQIQDVVQQQITAIQGVIDIVKKRTKESNYNPEIVYFSVNKRPTARFYDQNQKACYNPFPGSFLINEISTSGFFSFHLTAHKVAPSLVSCPAQFVLCHHQPKRTPLQSLVQFSYDQCYNYYNWKGSIRIPACLQNAEKLVKMASKHHTAEINSKNLLNRSFHFL